MEFQGVQPSILCVCSLLTHMSVTKLGWKQLGSSKKLKFVICLFDKGCVCSLLTSMRVLLSLFGSFKEYNLKLLANMSASGSPFSCPLGTRA